MNIYKLTRNDDWGYYIDRFLNWWAFTFKNPYNLNYPSGQAPVQIEGNLSTGEYYYFRARGSKWSVEIFLNEGDYYRGNNSRVFIYSEKYGETFEAGWLLKREAIKFATKAIDIYYETKI